MAQIRQPSVTSGSSPASLRTAAIAASSTRSQRASGTETAVPFGVTSRAVSGASPVSSKRAAADAANAAQVPVVIPRRSSFCPLRTKPLRFASAAISG